MLFWVGIHLTGLTLPHCCSYSKPGPEFSTSYVIVISLVSISNDLLDHGADMEAQSERTKDTPLSLACSGGRFEVIYI
jgi:ankyrin repeat protein